MTGRYHKVYQYAIFSVGIFFLLLTSSPSAGGQEDHTDPGEITAAVLSDFPPLYILDNTGKPQGFAIDILNRVAAKTGLRVHYLIVENWAAAMEAVRSGKADLIPGAGISEVRSSEFLFSEEIETIPVSCFVRSKNYEIDGIASLQGKQVAVLEKSAAETRLKERSDIRLVAFPNIDSALIQLLAGHVDAFVFPEPVLWKKAREAGVADKIKVAGLPLMELKRGFLLRQADAALLHQINRGIRAYIKSGDYLADYAKWYGKPEPYWNRRRTVYAMTSLVIMVIAGMAGWRYYSVVQFSRQLNRNIAIRVEAEKALQQAHDELEERVAARTRELKEEKEKAQKYFDIAGVMLGALNKTGEIILMNQKGCQILAVTEEEALGKNWFDHYLPDDIAGETKEVFNKLMAGETAAAEYYENPVLAGDGSQRLVAFHNTLLTDDAGRIKGVLFSGMDITERKRAEEEKARVEAQLRQALKMEAIGTLAGGIAHDFNNILSAIIGYSEIAIEDLPSDSRVARNLRKVLKAGFRARDLVKQILAFSRQANIDPIQLRPASIIKEGIKLLRSSIPATIEIHEDIDPATGVILADPTQLHQIIMNLSANAFHAMEEKGGRLTISLRQVELGRENLVNEPGVSAGTFARLIVQDTGTGIDPTIRNNIFDPYFTTKEPGKGTGMGLAIVHGIIKNSGGFITVDSEPGKGAAFKIFLPVVQEEMPSEQEMLDGIPSGKEKILFVDDEVQIADSSKMLLERLGYTVTVRKSSLEALETFHNQPDEFDLVITDQTMPGMTGTELARLMLRVRPDLPILLCTGYSSTITEAEARLLGIREFAFKPISIKRLAGLIRQVLEREPAGIA
ncbi:MAG: transporter substrate-binding domain-containing protein [Thermodesulfobacteriota bacterium]